MSSAQAEAAVGHLIVRVRPGRAASAGVPQDVLRCVLAFLGAVELGRAACVARDWRAATSADRVWWPALSQLLPPLEPQPALEPSETARHVVCTGMRAFWAEVRAQRQALAERAATVRGRRESLGLYELLHVLASVVLLGSELLGAGWVLGYLVARALGLPGDAWLWTVLLAEAVFLALHALLASLLATTCWPQDDQLRPLGWWAVAVRFLDTDPCAPLPLPLPIPNPIPAPLALPNPIALPLAIPITLPIPGAAVMAVRSRSTRLWSRPGAETLALLLAAALSLVLARLHGTGAVAWLSYLLAAMPLQLVLFAGLLAVRGNSCRGFGTRIYVVLFVLLGLPAAMDGSLAPLATTLTVVLPLAAPAFFLATAAGFDRAHRHWRPHRLGERLLLLTVVFVVPGMALVALLVRSLVVTHDEPPYWLLPALVPAASALLAALWELHDVYQTTSDATVAFDTTTSLAADELCQAQTRLAELLAAGPSCFVAAHLS